MSILVSRDTCKVRRKYGTVLTKEGFLSLLKNVSIRCVEEYLAVPDFIFCCI